MTHTRRMIVVWGTFAVAFGVLGTLISDHGSWAGRTRSGIPIFLIVIPGWFLMGGFGVGLLFRAMFSFFIMRFIIQEHQRKPTSLGRLHEEYGFPFFERLFALYPDGSMKR
jgi:hypothetical protein